MSASPFTVATSLGDALDALASGARPIAGGTDLVVGARQGKHQLPTNLVAIDRIAELRAIVETDEGLRIGSATTHATLMTDELIVSRYTALADAAALIGSPATRNVGTVGGNVMNGSPAMDTGAPLLALGASVELASTSGKRSVSLEELWVGPGTTSADEDELCVACVLPALPNRFGSAYVRLEYRRAMEIAVVGAAAAVQLDDSNRVLRVTVALSAVAPTIIKVNGLDQLGGQLVDEHLLARVASASSSQARPISDLRAGADYRAHMAGVMARRAVDAAARRASGQTIAVPVNRAEGVGKVQDS